MPLFADDIINSLRFSFSFKKYDYFYSCKIRLEFFFAASLIVVQPWIGLAGTTSPTSPSPGSASPNLNRNNTNQNKNLYTDLQTNKVIQRGAPQFIEAITVCIVTDV